MHLDEVARLIDLNILNLVDYDTVMLERVRDECGDFLKSLEMNTLEVQEVTPVDMAEGLGEATSNVRVRDV